MSRLVLDAGAFLAFEKGDVRVRSLLTASRKLGLELVTSSPVVSQVWRNGRRQALLAMLLRGTRIQPPDERAAKAAGELLAKTKTSDVVDALVVGLARSGDTILTSDPEDIERLLAAARSNPMVLRV